MRLLYCILYVAGIGIASHYLGNALPRAWFAPERFPYKPWKWEKDGQIYKAIGIQTWKDKVPDMSKLCPDMVRKEVAGRPTAESTWRLIQESCVAEFVHFALMIASLFVLRIWPGPWGWVAYALCILGNFPFMLIQRYNRPRLVRLYKKLAKKPR